MATVEQRVSYIEGRLDSLATRADLAQEVSRLEVKIERMMWAQLTALVMVGGLVVAALRLLE